MAGINLIMPMAGRGSRFLELGYNVPKPLIEIHGKPFFIGRLFLFLVKSKSKS